MVNKKFMLGLLVSLVLFSLVANVSAITASMGNARMILRVGTGEEVERSILVRNVNDVPITVDFTPTGDLADNVELRVKSISLNPGEEEKAYFTIKADKEGTTETKINVRFTPPEGNGVGLTSTITVIASGEDVFIENEDDLSTQPEENNQEEKPGFSLTPSARNTQVENKASGIKLSPILFLLISSIALFVVLILLLIYSNKRNSKKRARRPRE